MVFFHIWGLNSCHMKVPYKLMLRFYRCGVPRWVAFLLVTRGIKYSKSQYAGVIVQRPMQMLVAFTICSHREKMQTIFLGSMD